MKPIKYKALAAAVAGLVASQGALALNPADTNAATLQIYVTGGGSADTNLEASIKGLLIPATTDIYTYGGNRKNFWAVSGKLQNALGSIAANTSVAFYKRTLGAAYTATTVATGTAVDHLDVTSAGAAVSGVRNVTVDPTHLKKVVSDAGYSDVPVSLFAASVNIPPSETPVSSDALSALVVKPINAALHGIAVTKGLRDALQQLEGLTVGDESEANIPSLSIAALASIYQGRISTWDQLVYNGTALTVPAGYDPNVYVVPRSPGAAAQASINARILNTPSNPNASGPAPENFDPPAPFVWEASLPGDVDTILDGLDRDPAAGFNWTDTSGASIHVSQFGKKRLAIGSQSTEKNTGVAPPAASTTRDALNYRFIKIDGAAPTVQNAYNGTYPLTVEAQIVYSSALAGPKKEFVNDLADRIGKPSVLGGNNTNFYHGYGQTGYLGLSTTGNAVPSAFNPTLPVTGYTYEPDGTPDIGRPPVLDQSVDSSQNPLVPKLILK